jgi:hypothetical protein
LEHDELVQIPVFLALLDLVADNLADGTRFASREIVIGMLAWARYPHFFFRLSLARPTKFLSFWVSLLLRICDCERFLIGGV